MKVKELELRTIHLPLVRPFRTSFGTQNAREVIILKLTCLLYTSPSPRDS